MLNPVDHVMNSIRNDYKHLYNLRMKKHGFKVELNGKQLCKAGFQEDNSVLTCILDSIQRTNAPMEELNLSVSGLNSETKQHASWLHEKLNEGDKITIEVISDDFESPKELRQAISEEDLIQQKVKQYHKLKEELKEYLQE